MGVHSYSTFARRWRAVIVVPVVALVFGGLSATPAMAAPADTAVQNGGYVALGDSYAAGPLIPDPTGLPIGCLRSTGNYPQLVGDALGGVTDVSCSGATTSDLFSPQDTEVGTAPPQVDALSADTRVVTLTIGGNDIGFVSILTECAQRSVTDPFGAACRDFYNQNGYDELRQRIAETASDVRGALGEIANRAPNATVALVGYPALLPESGHCFPTVPFSPGDVTYLRGINQDLNAMLASEAAQADITWVSTYEEFAGHDMCAPDGEKWIEAIIPTSPAAPVHPNAAGMQAMSRPVIDALASFSVLAAP